MAQAEIISQREELGSRAEELAHWHLFAKVCFFAFRVLPNSNRFSYFFSKILIFRETFLCFRLTFDVYANTFELDCKGLTQAF